MNINKSCKHVPDWWPPPIGPLHLQGHIHQLRATRVAGAGLPRSRLPGETAPWAGLVPVWCRAALRDLKLVPAGHLRGDLLPPAQVGGAGPTTPTKCHCEPCWVMTGSQVLMGTSRSLQRTLGSAACGDAAQPCQGPQLSPPSQNCPCSHGTRLRLPSWGSDVRSSL